MWARWMRPASVGNAKTLNPASTLVCVSVNASQIAQVKIVGRTDAGGSAVRAQSVRSAAQMVSAEKVVSPIAQARNAGRTDAEASVETARADGHVTTRTCASKMVVSRTAQEKSAVRTDVAASVAVVLLENLAALARAKGDVHPIVVARYGGRCGGFCGQDAPGGLRRSKHVLMSAGNDCANAIEVNTVPFLEAGTDAATNAFSFGSNM